jgi:hypothetical protein
MNKKSPTQKMDSSKAFQASHQFVCCDSMTYEIPEGLERCFPFFLNINSELKIRNFRPVKCAEISQHISGGLAIHELISQDTTEITPVMARLQINLPDEDDTLSMNKKQISMDRCG